MRIQGNHPEMDTFSTCNGNGTARGLGQLALILVYSSGAMSATSAPVHNNWMGLHFVLQFLECLRRLAEFGAGQRLRVFEFLQKLKCSANLSCTSLLSRKPACHPWICARMSATKATAPTRSCISVDISRNSVTSCCSFDICDLAPDSLSPTARHYFSKKPCPSPV